jgi:RNA polymerase sigma factor (sigma-70 family)
VSATEGSLRTRSRVVDLEQLFHEYSGPVYRYCLARLGSPEEAEDAVQVTYLNALRGLRQGTQPDEPRAWLFTIAANVSSTLLRSRLRGGKVEVRAPEDFERLPAGEVPDDLVDLDAALMSLPVRQRQALLLRDWRGLSYAEIAAELDASEPAVETLLFRARQAVAEFLTKPARRLRRTSFRTALPALIPWPSALSGAKSWLMGGATAKALAIAVGASAPIIAFGVVDHTLMNRGISPAPEKASLGAEVRSERPQEVSRSLPAPPEATRLRTSAAAAHELSSPKTVRHGTQTASTAADPATSAGGAAPVSQPTDSTQPSVPPSTDPPAEEAGADLVTICHLTGSKKHPAVTISVAAAAVDAHLAHGDQLGPCAS